MKEYKVLKPFIDFKNKYYPAGGTFCPDYDDITNSQKDFIHHLDQCGFIEKIPEQPKTVWDLKDGDRCCMINGAGCVMEYKFDRMSWRNDPRDIGIIFLTREEAEKELARRKAKVILLRDTKGFKPDWDKTVTPEITEVWIYTVHYDHISRQLGVNGFAANQLPCEIWFATREAAEASIKAHEKDWMIYLGIHNQKVSIA